MKRESFSWLNLGTNRLAHTGEEVTVIHIDAGDNPFIFYVDKNGMLNKANLSSFMISIPEPESVIVTDRDIYKWRTDNAVNDFSRMVRNMHEGQYYKITFELITDSYK